MQLLKLLQLDWDKQIPSLEGNLDGKDLLNLQQFIQYQTKMNDVELRLFKDKCRSFVESLRTIIDTSAKSVLLGKLNPNDPQALTREGLAHLVELKKLSHLEIGFIPEGKPLLLHGVLTLPKLTSLKLVSINSEFDDLKIIFYDYRIETIVLDSCSISPYNWYVGRDPNSDSKSKTKVFTLKNSTFPFYNNIIDSLEEIVIDTSDYGGDVYIAMLNKCKKMVVPKQRIIRGIRDRMSYYDMHGQNIDDLMAKIIVHKE